MDFKEIYKEESGHDVGRYNIDNTNYYSEDYVEWLEKKLRIGSVVGRSEQLDTAEKRNIFNDGYSLGLKTGKRQLEKGV